MNSIHTTIVVYNGNRVHVPSSDSVAAAMTRYGIALNEQQVSQVQRYISCLVFWNQRVSLTSVTDLSEILERHFAESMTAAPLIHPQNGRLADVGSGPGFPGLALKILLPKLQVFLIERDTKKSAFLNEVIRFANLDQTTVIRADYELIQANKEEYDYLTARALGDHKALLRWSSTHLSVGGKIMLWLGEQDSTKLAQAKGWYWDPPTSIPHSQRRVILVGRPIE
jgi:16S rRNA (guanine527-N7)-methyltransferase